MSIFAYLTYWTMLNPLLATLWATAFLMLVLGINNLLVFRWIKKKFIELFERFAKIEGFVIDERRVVEEVGKTFS